MEIKYIISSKHYYHYKTGEIQYFLEKSIFFIEWVAAKGKVSQRKIIQCPTGLIQLGYNL